LGDVLGGEVFLAILGGCFFFGGFFLKSLDKDFALILEHLLHFLASSKCGGEINFHGFFL
jgi:hypothetical protein